MDGAVLAEADIRRVRVSARLARVARRLEFPDGGRFETDDNDGTDALLRDVRAVRRFGLVDRIERSWRWVAAAVVVAVLCAYGFVAYGIPAIALKLAQATPPDVAVSVSNQTMETMDGTVLEPTHLGAADVAHARALFARVAAASARSPHAYRLLFRDSRSIGPNAFALLDGRIVMTDELWRMVKNDEEIEGVFGHEIAHVVHAHGLQRIYQASLVPAAFAFITGDISQVSQIASVLPGILVQSAYSRGFEQQADDDAAATLKRIGAHPSRLADFLQRLDKTSCEKDACPPSWLGTHPDTASRAARLRAEDTHP